jgi:hypothetical protein
VAVVPSAVSGSASLLFFGERIRCAARVKDISQKKNIPALVVHRVAGPGPIGTWGPPPAPAFVLLAVLGGGRSGSGHGHRRID